jgi:putative transposase
VKTIGGEIECSVAVLKDVKATRLNEVGAMEITEIPTACGFVSLAAVNDWFTRQVQSGRLPITLEADFFIKSVEEALARHGEPDIFNTGQGSQFTSIAFTQVLKDA